MEDGYGRLIRQFTSVALVAAVILVGLGAAGYAPSLVFAVPAAALAGAAFSVRDRLIAAAPYRVLAVHAESLWIGPALAAGVLVVYGGISPGELQTVGAVIGLLGMANYLLRPVYILVASVAARVARAV
jgi:hypothetical protein